MDAASTSLERLASQATLAPERRGDLAEKLRARLSAQRGSAVGEALATVELAIAVHTVVPNPAVSVIWDVGDHRLPYHLLSGEVGSSDGRSTSGRAVSEGVGRAVARTLLGDPEPVFVVLDEAGLSTGLAYEAVAHAGQLRLPLVLVLIDFQTHRSRSVGILARYFARIRSHPRYTDAKSLIETALRGLPASDHTVELARRLKNSIRELVLPTEMWEELLGFLYLGPVDGNNLSALNDILTLARETRRPVVVHAVVQAGRGLEPESRATTDAIEARVAPTWSLAIGAAIESLVAIDNRAVVVAAMPAASSGLTTFAEASPERFFELGLGEAHAVSFAESLADANFRPVLVIDASHFPRAIPSLLRGAGKRAARLTVIGMPHAHAESGDLALAASVGTMRLALPTTDEALTRSLANAFHGSGTTYVRPMFDSPRELTAPDAMESNGNATWNSNAALAFIALGTAVPAAVAAALATGRRAEGITWLPPTIPLSNAGDEQTLSQVVLAVGSEAVETARLRLPLELLRIARMVTTDTTESLDAQRDLLIAALG